MLLNTTLLCLFVDLVVAFLAVRRTTVVSPLSIFAIFNFVCLAYFYFTVDLGHRPVMQLSSMPLDGLQPYSEKTAIFYAMLNVSCLPVIYSISPIKSADFTQMANRFRFLLSNLAIIAFLSVLALLTLVHLFDFDLTYLWSYRGYHQINDAELVGISNPISLLYHRFGPTLAALSFCVAIICYQTRRFSLVLPACILGLYGFLLVLASSSREMAIFFIFPALTHYLFKRRADFFVSVLAVLAALSVIFAVSTRGKQADLGISHLPDQIGALSFVNLVDVLVSLFSNIAQGAVDFAHTLRLSPDYPFIYKAVSLLSPLPGSLDDWDSIREQYQVRISLPTPIGALGETHYFGWEYFLGLIITSLLLLRAATIQMFRKTSLMTIPIYGFTILLIYRLHHYPTRISQRIILVILIFYAVDYFLRQRNMAADRRRLAARAPRPMPREMKSRPVLDRPKN